MNKRKITNPFNVKFEPFDNYGPLVPGMNWHMITYSKETGQGTYILKMDPGTRSLPHKHTNYEEFLMLEGELVDPEKAKSVGFIDEIIESDQLLDHSIETMNKWFKLPFDKQIQSKLTLRKQIIDLMLNTAEQDNDEVIEAWFSDECRLTMGSIVDRLVKK